jgi:hypothetical protein
MDGWKMLSKIEMVIDHFMSFNVFGRAAFRFVFVRLFGGRPRAWYFPAGRVFVIREEVTSSTC